MGRFGALEAGVLVLAHGLVLLICSLVIFLLPVFV